MSQEIDGGYWEVAQERMTELFGELDWEKLKSLGRAEREGSVRKKAEEKFVGANEEDCKRYESQK